MLTVRFSLYLHALCGYKHCTMFYANKLFVLYCILYIKCDIVVFGFEGGIWVLIDPVPGHCILVTLIGLAL